MSFFQNYRSKSPKSSALRLLSPTNIASSPRKVTTPFSGFTISIKGPQLQSKEKGLRMNDLSNKCKSIYVSPGKAHLLPPKTSKSANSSISSKLNEYKQKVSRIQGLLLGENTPQKKTRDGEQPVRKFEADHENLEKIHYKSDKVNLSCSSETKSMTSSASTQGTHQDGSYRRLNINGQPEIFKEIKFINKGCYGKVYLVQHVSTNFICCLKVIAKEGLTPQIKAQIVKEIKIQTYLAHPNIVAIYGYSHDEENVYLLLQACLGGNLFERIQASELGEREVANTVKEACRALDFMHSNDIIHRDIKPQNILLHEGTAKVCDFGWAIHSPLLRSTQCGTPLYLSPEVICSDLYDSKVDVWSIGILTYELLFRRIPFDIQCMGDLAKIVKDKVSFEGREVSAQAQEFILRCLSKVPRERLSMEQALDHSFLIKDNSKYRQTIN